jgi:UDP-N-acetylglucosamine 4,6-dehydratase/5-epimerase
MGMKKVLITGGSGFVGRSLIKALFARYPDIEITSLSRSEGFISQLLVECPNKKLQIEIADLRDAQAMNQIARDKDTLIHLAAMKRVDLCEAKCREAATINVVGTINILDAFAGDTFIQMSTDKAVEPCNCYGATKLVAERMVLERANKADKGTRFMIVRCGNILGSTGSVMDIWKTQILQNNEITVTHPDMMRYYTSVDGVTKLYIAVLELGQNGKLYHTPSGDAIILKDMIAKAIKLYGNDNTKVKYVGLRLGERMVEKMCTPSETYAVADFPEKVGMATDKVQRL